MYKTCFTMSYLYASYKYTKTTCKVCSKSAGKTRVVYDICSHYAIETPKQYGDFVQS